MIEIGDIPAWLKMQALACANPLFFALRNRVAFRRAGYEEDPSDERGLTAATRPMLASARATQLTERYALESIRLRITPLTFLNAIHYIDILDQLFAKMPELRDALPGEDSVPIDVLDIGAKNFESALALGPVFRSARVGAGERGEVRLTGVEIDAYRVYRSRHSRADVAIYYLSLVERPESGSPHRFLPEDLLGHEGAYDAITWFHPFLDAYPLLHWGLPRWKLQPEAMFDKMMALLKPGGVAIVVNQEPKEKEMQTEMMERMGVAFESFDIELSFAREKKVAYAHVIRKERNAEPD